MEAPDIRLAFYKLTDGKEFVHNNTVYERYSIDEIKEKILLYPKGSRVASEIPFEMAGGFLKRVHPVINITPNKKRPKFMKEDLDEEQEELESDLPIKMYNEDDNDDEAVKEEIEKLPAQRSSTEVQFVTTQDIKVTISDLKNILMGTIKKVEKSKDYIQQANAVNQSVNTLINLAKLSLTVNQKKV